MQEDFLWYIWQHRLFDDPNLRSSQNQSIFVEHPGYLNRDAGPDFNLARLKLNGQRWVGQVEMHVKSSDWLKHGHQTDPAYHNVILHVVWENDCPIHIRKPGDLPVIELRHFVKEERVERYRSFISQPDPIACRGSISGLDQVILRQWMDRMSIEKLSAKTVEVKSRLDRHLNDWQEVLYILLARAFGMRVNSDAFEWLVTSTPYRILARYRSKENLMEALLFGQSGMLDSGYHEHYPALLLDEYKLWRKALGLEPIPPGSFKSMRMHPAAFPGVRIAQFCALIKHVHPLTALLSDNLGLAELLELIRVEPHAYWQTHYRFGKEVKAHSARAGEDLAHRVVLHALIPVLFAYAEVRGDSRSRERAIHLLEQLPAESNRIISLWQDVGITPCSAADTQALVHAYKNWCSSKKCVSCLIGRRILSN